MNDLIEDWLLQQNIVARNYMRHHDIKRALRAWLRENSPRTLRILDLGCGDGYMARAAFKGNDNVQYYGVDTSPQALTVARANFADQKWSVELLEGDIIKMIQKLHGPFDLVIGGYSMHFLTQEQKEMALNNIRMVLPPNGALILYDLLPRPRERERKNQFTERFSGELSGWKNLGENQLAAFRDHIQSTSHPLDQSAWQALCRQSALGHGKLLYRDPEELFGLIVFST